MSDDMDGSGSEAGGIGAHNDDLTRRIMALEHDNVRFAQLFLRMTARRLRRLT